MRDARPLIRGEVLARFGAVLIEGAADARSDNRGVDHPCYRDLEAIGRDDEAEPDPEESTHGRPDTEAEPCLRALFDSQGLQLRLAFVAVAREHDDFLFQESLLAQLFDGPARSEFVDKGGMDEPRGLQIVRRFVRHTVLLPSLRWSNRCATGGIAPRRAVKCVIGLE